jgi:hypothetical protein
LADTLGRTGGLGTVATRADIIEKLYDSFLIEKKGKDIYSTPKGRQLLKLAPAELKSPDLTGQWEQKLQRIADILKTIPRSRILVAGHTALAGTQEDQQRTSMERAQAVASYLISLGARTANEITVQGFGAERPIASNQTEAGMEANRRVEITILDR